MGEPLDPGKSVQCFRYSVDLLRQLLAEASGTPVESVEAKLHLTYFEQYFAHFQNHTPLTIVVEWQYTDRDFLEDYASYYVRCFDQKYKARCVRLHFFKGELDESILRSHLSRPRGELEQDLNARYLGFVVVKPIPHTLVGRTCLRTYDDDGGRRFFPVKQSCQASLLGIRLHVDSLEYQEQDTVAAACATSALWSVLHATALLFQHKVYTPVEITRIATEKFPSLRRVFPNKGLTAPQIAAAIRAIGLEPEVLAVREKPELQSRAYAYLRAGIPSLLIGALFDLSDPDHPIPLDNDWENWHGVAVTGYSTGRSLPEPFSGTPTVLRSSRIDKLYVHDDQVGPFSRLEFDAPPFSVARGSADPWQVNFAMRSSWRGCNGKVGSVCFAPISLIVPVYHKIRVSCRLVLERVLEMDEDFRGFFVDRTPSLVGPDELEWDVFLTSSNRLKDELRDSKELPDHMKWTHLERAFPRFLWRATGYVRGIRMVDILYDATDIAQSTSLEVAQVWYSIPDPS